jgi:hypothetical protein
MFHFYFLASTSGQSVLNVAMTARTLKVRANYKYISLSPAIVADQEAQEIHQQNSRIPLQSELHGPALSGGRRRAQAMLPFEVASSSFAIISCCRQFASIPVKSSSWFCSSCLRHRHGNAANVRFVAVDRLHHDAHHF